MQISVTKSGIYLMFDNSHYLKTTAETRKGRHMLLKLLMNCVIEIRFEIITEPELRVNDGYAYISAIAIMKSTRFWR